MAARRLSLSAVNWAAFAERVPPGHKDAFRAFKAKSDALVSRVHKYPENVPSIDWSFYKSKFANPAMVDEFKKQYEAISVPYPKDSQNIKAEIQSQEKLAQEQSAQDIDSAKECIAEFKAWIEAYKTLPPMDEMTKELACVYFPEDDEPKFWPFQSVYQSDANGGPGNEIKPGTIKLGKINDYTH